MAKADTDPGLCVFEEKKTSDSLARLFAHVRVVVDKLRG